MVHMVPGELARMKQKLKIKGSFESCYTFNSVVNKMHSQGCGSFSPIAYTSYKVLWQSMQKLFGSKIVASGANTQATQPLKTLKLLQSVRRDLFADNHSIFRRHVTDNNPEIKSNFKTQMQIFHVGWLLCHHGMVRPQVADGGDSMQVRRIAENTTHKQLRRADQGWSSSLSLRLGTNRSN